MKHGICAAILLLCLVCTCLWAFPATVQSKEVEATSEWTLLGENDTVAAGMHVRMDLTTGEKWVKTIDENESDKEVNNNVNVNTNKIIFK